jgi:hypothetical protein
MTTVRTPTHGLSSAAALSGISSKLQKNLLFMVLVIVGNSVGALVMAGATYAMATQDHFTGASLYFGYLADGIPAALFVAAAVLTVAVAVRTWRMLNAANGGDIAALKSLSSPGWAVVAIFACWVVPGITLLKVNTAIRGTQDRGAITRRRAGPERLAGSRWTRPHRVAGPGPGHPLPARTQTAAGRSFWSSAGCRPSLSATCRCCRLR